MRSRTLEVPRVWAPDPEVPANPQRRQFTTDYKRSILD
jgi:hypothetical protein